MAEMKARYEMRVTQGNSRAVSVPVTVIASSAQEAKRKALALTDVHSPITTVIRIEEITRD